MSYVDPLFKQLLVETVAREGVIVETEFEVSRLPRTIDAIVKLTDLTVLPDLAASTPYNWFRQFNAIAFKGANDPLTERDYHLIWGRAYLAFGENSITAQDATLTIICGRTPRNEMTRLRREVALVEHGAGVYQVGLHLPRCYLIVVNELPQEAGRYAILNTFSSSRQRYASYLRQLYAEREFELIGQVSLAHPDWATEVFMSIDFSAYPKYQQDALFRLVFDVLIPKLDAKDELVARVLPTLSIEKRLEGMSPEERLAGISPEERLAGISPEEMVEGLSAEEKERLRELLSASE